MAHLEQKSSKLAQHKKRCVWMEQVVKWRKLRREQVLKLRRDKFKMAQVDS
jgi:hypothetical protein